MKFLMKDFLVNAKNFLRNFVQCDVVRMSLLLTVEYIQNIQLVLFTNFGYVI